jgi:23S rRNA pseudouridine1911/1915/1917 synthase
VSTTPVPRIGRITLPLARDPLDRRRMVVTAGGAASETRYAVITDATNGVALVACTLVTGRTHQIRVHMAASGWPLVGDRVYGRADAAIGRQALHSWRITMRHPVTRAPLAFESPLPPDMRALLEGDDRA